MVLTLHLAGDGLLFFATILPPAGWACSRNTTKSHWCYTISVFYVITCFYLTCRWCSFYFSNPNPHYFKFPVSDVAPSPSRRAKGDFAGLVLCEACQLPQRAFPMTEPREDYPKCCWCQAPVRATGWRLSGHARKCSERPSAYCHCWELTVAEAVPSASKCPFSSSPPSGWRGLGPGCFCFHWSHPCFVPSQDSLKVSNGAVFSPYKTGTISNCFLTRMG